MSIVIASVFWAVFNIYFKWAARFNITFDFSKISLVIFVLKWVDF
jgi:hypothetical protein